MSEMQIDRIQGMVLSMMRTMQMWTGSTPEEMDIFVNGLLPLAEDESVHRELSIVEIDSFCLLHGMGNRFEKVYKESSTERECLISLLNSMRSALFWMPSLNRKWIEGETHYWGLRRYKGVPIWAVRPPTKEERVLETIRKLQGDINP